MEGSWHALDGAWGFSYAKAYLPGKGKRWIERTREREREEEEREGWNLGRPAPRVPRKLGQVFCTCRSNAGTFATVFIILPFLFAITSPPPLSPPFPALLSSLLLSASSLPRKLEIVPETVWETNGYKRWWITTLLFVSFIGWWFFLLFS